ncbi:patatin-like phospholipase family protein [Olivibacter domesticus]|uniref:Patatin-like phospholipase n=1 Tax=Olivibacter domesticus TaxID=407022 RepID=A0A1H7W971_OLID1|nr:patatin-like phospholipase family protein [Olivibacter domesticus]SEM17625.1 Patatin-like phospholipase [Olivibacter domesticus]
MDRSFKTTKNISNTPFDNIALAFSGGGFRAASFSLGVLSYLDEITLIDKVTFISSASGGTITNALYALNIAKGGTFASFYKKLKENLEGTGLLNHVFEKLNNDKEWISNPDKRRNIINAFALTYDDDLFDHSLLEDLYQHENSTSLEEVCFNTTEFYKGLLFRQNVKMKIDHSRTFDNQFRYGNFNINLNFNAAGKLKLADLLAASSCFPAGFEPIIFPDDFTYKTLSGQEDTTVANLDKRTLLDNLYVGLQELNISELEKLFGKERVTDVINGLPHNPSVESVKNAFINEKIRDDFKIGMMDGGITDNQALESMIDAQKRRVKEKTTFRPFDLMLVNDVGSHYMEPYKLPTGNDSYTGIKAISIKTVIVILWVLMLLGISLIAGLIPKTDTFGVRWPVIIGTTITILSGSILLILNLIRRFIEGNTDRLGGLNLNKNFSPSIVSNLFEHFASTPIMVIFRMLKERISSVLVLNNDVFLKRIRFLLYDKTYESGKYRFKIKTNHVYDLSFSNDLNRHKKGLNFMEPSKSIQIIAQTAFEMATTLWFDTTNQKNETLAALIACGQFTTCYNLLEYIYRLKTTKSKSGDTYYSGLTPTYQQKIDYLERQLSKDYLTFKEDPFWLYNKCGVNFQLTNFKSSSMENFLFPSPSFAGLR